MRDYSKSEKRTLRSLAATAWDAEMQEALTCLYDSFVEWERGSVVSAELVSRIHEFHDGDARRIYNLYNGLDPDQLVARALAKDYLDPSVVPEGLIGKLSSAVALFSEEPSPRP